jgi:peptidoglycan/LPS O-acetylase OafA/YrhL
LTVAGASTQARYTTLDGLRGVAAVLVLAFHLIGQDGDWTSLRGYLAVDFFFVLSGFVIAHAYERRFAAGLGVGRFLGARLLRLYPVMLVGAVAGAVVFAAKAGAPAPPAAFASHLLWMPLSGGYDLFPLNVVQWSLTLEVLANVAHALILRRLGPRTLALIAGVALIGLLATARHWGTLNLGAHAVDWWGGPLRLAFSYTVGVLLYRLRDSWLLARAPRLPFIARARALVGSVLFVSAHPLHRLGDVLAVGLLLPLIVLLGIRAREMPALAALEDWSGRLSFPLYGVHLPIVVLLAQQGFTGSLGGKLAAGLLAIAAALVVHLLVERPSTSASKALVGRPHVRAATAGGSPLRGGSGPTSLPR